MAIVCHAHTANIIPFSSGGSRTLLTQFSTPVPAGYFFPGQESKTLRCVDGFDFTGQTPHRAQWFGHGKLNDDGSFPYINIRSWCRIVGGLQPLTFTEPPQFPTGSNNTPQTITVFPAHQLNKIEFDDQAVPSIPFSVHPAVAAQTSGGVNAMRIEVDIDFTDADGVRTQETLSIPVDRSQATVTRSDPAGGGNDLAIRYSQRARFPAPIDEWGIEFLYEIQSNGMPNEAREVPFSFSIYRSNIDAEERILDTSDPFDGYTVDGNMSGPLEVRIVDPHGLVDSRIYRADETISAWLTPNANANHGYRLWNPDLGSSVISYLPGDQGSTGLSYSQAPYGILRTRHGSLFFTDGISTAGLPDRENYQSWQYGADFVETITTAWRDGHPSDHPQSGELYETYGEMGHIPTWVPEPSTNPIGQTYPGIYDSDERGYAAAAAAVERDVLRPYVGSQVAAHASRAANYDGDWNASPHLELSLIHISEPTRPY